MKISDDFVIWFAGSVFLFVIVYPAVAITTGFLGAQDAERAMWYSVVVSPFASLMAIFYTKGKAKK